MYVCIYIYIYIYDMCMYRYMYTSINVLYVGTDLLQNGFAMETLFVGVANTCIVMYVVQTYMCILQSWLGPPPKAPRPPQQLSPPDPPSSSPCDPPPLGTLPAAPFPTPPGIPVKTFVKTFVETRWKLLSVVLRPNSIHDASP